MQIKPNDLKPVNSLLGSNQREKGKSQPPIGKNMPILSVFATREISLDYIPKFDTNSRVKSI
jgi:hypothetical protein